MKTAIICITITSFLFFLSCDDESPTNSSTKTYKYTGYDSSWNKIITGYLWIDNIDSLEVKGRWNFYLVGSEENFGPQIGRGNFEGTVHPLGTLTLNLNPEGIDNNVILDGSMRLPYRINGSWSYVGFPGELNWGRFEAAELR